MKPTKLDISKVKSFLKEGRSSGWSIVDEKLYKKFKFKNFKEAFSFMSFVAEIAEDMDHHPDWYNSYSTVEIFLCTHCIAGLTELDLVLAERINKLIKN